MADLRALDHPVTVTLDPSEVAAVLDAAWLVHELAITHPGRWRETEARMDALIAKLHGAESRPSAPIAYRPAQVKLTTGGFGVVHIESDTHPGWTPCGQVLPPGWVRRLPVDTAVTCLRCAKEKAAIEAR